MEFEMADEQHLRIKQALAQYHLQPEADAARLALPHQRVRLFNSCNQTHVVFDRGRKPVQVRPGERVEADMLIEDIAFYSKQRAEPRPLIPRPNDRGVMTMVPAPKHPIVIEDLPPAAAGLEQASPAVPVVDDTDQLAKMNALAAANEHH
jgi:hypothetical protein